jgi:integrase
MNAPENFSALFDLFVTLRSSYVRSSTISGSLIPTKKCVMLVMGDPIGRDVTNLDLLQFVQTLLKPRSRDGKTLPPRTRDGINSTLRNLRTFGHWCTRQALLPQGNAFAVVEMLRVPDKSIRFMSREEFRKVFLAEPREELRRVYFWGLLTGLRIGTLVRIDWSDIDTKRALIRVNDQKPGRSFVLPLHLDLLDMIPRMCPKNEGPIFGKVYSVSYISHRFKKAARQAGYPDLSAHSLRRTFGSWLVKSGVNLFEVSKLMNHSSPELTRKHYASLLPSELGRYLERLAPATGSVSVVEEGEYSAIVRDYVGSKKT